MKAWLYDRLFVHWKTTVGGSLALALAIVGAVHTSNPTAHWTISANAVIVAVLGWLAKDN